MLSRLIKGICILSFLAFAGTAQAQEAATSDQAMALVKKAVAVWKSDGRGKALEVIADPNGGFKEKDKVLYVQDLKGVMVYHPWNPGFIGKDLSELRDPDGKLWVADMIKVANEKGSGWVEYKFLNPTTKKLEPRASYVERVDDVLIGCAISR